MIGGVIDDRNSMIHELANRRSTMMNSYRPLAKKVFKNGARPKQNNKLSVRLKIIVLESLLKT